LRVIFKTPKINFLVLALSIITISNKPRSSYFTPVLHK